MSQEGAWSFPWVCFSIPFSKHQKVWDEILRTFETDSCFFFFFHCLLHQYLSLHSAPVMWCGSVLASESYQGKTTQTVITSLAAEGISQVLSPCWCHQSCLWMPKCFMMGSLCGCLLWGLQETRCPASAFGLLSDWSGSKTKPDSNIQKTNKGRTHILLIYALIYHISGYINIFMSL